MVAVRRWDGLGDRFIFKIVNPPRTPVFPRQPRPSVGEIVAFSLAGDAGVALLREAMTRPAH